MATIYLVTFDDPWHHCTSTEIRGAYTTREKADAAIEQSIANLGIVGPHPRARDGYDIEEVDLA